MNSNAPNAKDRKPQNVLAKEPPGNARESLKRRNRGKTPNGGYVGNLRKKRPSLTSREFEGMLRDFKAIYHHHSEALLEVGGFYVS